jgi:hypothetical protein
VCLVNIEARIEMEFHRENWHKDWRNWMERKAGGETAEGGYIAGEPLVVQRRRTVKDSVRSADDNAR